MGPGSLAVHFHRLDMEMRQVRTLICVLLSVASFFLFDTLLHYDVFVIKIRFI